MVESAARTDDAVSRIGDYTVTSVLGRGAMGVVYRGHLAGSTAPVAIKTVRADLLASSERDAVLKRFFREADIAGHLQHDNIVKVFGSGDDHGTVYMAMELVEGRELKDFTDDPRAHPLDEILGYIQQMLDALAYAHHAGVVHRDIKPANVMVRPDARIKLMDFGIARVESSEMTGSGTLLGTPAYMAPEQFMGEAVDARADIYAAGVTLYHLLTGRKPFSGALAKIIHDVLSTTPAPPSTYNPLVNRKLDQVVARAMAKRREDRYQRVEELASDLRAALVLARAEAHRPAADDDATVMATLVDDGGGLADLVAQARAAAAAAQQDEESLFTSLEKEVTAIAHLLAQAMEREASHALVAALRDHLQRFVEQAAGANADGRINYLRDEGGAAVLGDAIPGLRQLIIDGAPLPARELTLDDQRTDWMELVGVLALLRANLRRLGAAAEAEKAVEAVVRALSMGALAYSNEINRIMFSPDPVFLPEVSANFMRLDILQWALEELEAQAELQSLRQSQRMIAGQILRKVNQTVREFVERGDEFARFDVATLLEEVEELTVLATRLVEEGPDTGGGADGGYMKMLGREIVIEFIETARRLVALLVDELAQELAAEVPDAALIAARLRQLAGIYQFSVRLDEEGCRPKLLELTGESRAAAERLAGQARAALATIRADGGSDRENPQVRALLDVLGAMYDLAEEVGWVQLAQSLLTDLRDRVLMGGEG